MKHQKFQKILPLAFQKVYTCPDRDISRPFMKNLVESMDWSKIHASDRFTPITPFLAVCSLLYSAGVRMNHLAWRFRTRQAQPSHPDEQSRRASSRRLPLYRSRGRAGCARGHRANPSLIRTALLSPQGFEDLQVRTSP